MSRKKQDQEAIDEEARNLKPPAPPVPRSFAVLDQITIQQALIDNKGDLFSAAPSLGVSVRRLNQAIKNSAQLQNLMLQIEQTAVLPEYEAMTAKQFEAAIRERLSAYRVDGLDALHDLATMPIGDDADMAKVKLSAASKLAGTEEGQFGGSSEMGDILRQLNESYHANAPRIRVVRQTSIEMVSDERVVNPG